MSARMMEIPLVESRPLSATMTRGGLFFYHSQTLCERTKSADSNEETDYCPKVAGAGRVTRQQTNRCRLFLGHAAFAGRSAAGSARSGKPPRPKGIDRVLATGVWLARRLLKPAEDGSNHEHASARGGDRRHRLRRDRRSRGRGLALRQHPPLA